MSEFSALGIDYATQPRFVVDGDIRVKGLYHNVAGPLCPK